MIRITDMPYKAPAAPTVTLRQSLLCSPCVGIPHAVSSCLVLAFVV